MGKKFRAHEIPFKITMTDLNKEICLKLLLNQVERLKSHFSNF